MFYRLLGMLAWKAGRWWFRHAVGRTPWPVVAGAGALALAGALFASRKRGE